MAKQVTTVAPAEDNSLVSASSSPALALWFNDEMYRRCEQIASRMANAKGIIPSHLIGNVDSCFMVVETALTWRLSPRAVAQSTYMTPNGRIGYEGKLCIAILEASGKIDGPVRFEHIGDWTKVQGKFEIATSDKGTKYPRGTYKPQDEEGLGVKVSAQVRGEATPREITFMLRQAFPRNSTLWATDPKTQICYTAARRFGSVAAPSLMMGVPFDRDDEMPGDSALDVTSRSSVADKPRREEFREPAREPVADLFVMVNEDGEEETSPNGEDLAAVYRGKLVAAGDEKVLDALWESNGLIMSQLRERGLAAVADDLQTVYASKLDEFDKARRDAARARDDDVARAAALADAKKREEDAAADAAPQSSQTQHGDQRHDAPLHAPDRNERFFNGDSYRMQVPVENNRTLWQKFDKWQRDASRDCRTTAELTKLMDDNKANYDDFEKANSNGAYLLRQHIEVQRKRVAEARASAEADSYGGK